MGFLPRVLVREVASPAKHKSLVELFRLLRRPFGFLVITTAVPRTTPIVKDELYFTSEICSCLDRVSSPMALKTCSRSRYRFKMLDSKCSANNFFCSFFYSFAEQTVPFLLSQYGSKVVIPSFVFYYLTDKLGKQCFPSCKYVWHIRSILHLPLSPLLPVRLVVSLLTNV